MATSASQKISEYGARCVLAAQREAAMLRKNETIVEIGKGLRRQDEDITQAPLPRRWVDLIHHLNEQERKQAEAGNQRRSRVA